MNNMFPRGLAAAAVWLFLSCSLHADLIVDSNLSTTTITILGVSDSSATSGFVTLTATPSESPFETAQITDMNLVLDEGLNFSLIFGAVTITSVGGEVEVNMVSPGPAGTIVGGEFNQLGNTVGASGVLTQTDPGNLNGGSGTLDLGSLGTPLVDFNNVEFSTVGETSTIDLDYSITELINGIAVTIEGRVVASGTVTGVPEPAGAGLLWTGVLLWVSARRKR